MKYGEDGLTASQRRRYEQNLAAITSRLDEVIIVINRLTADRIYGDAYQRAYAKRKRIDAERERLERLRERWKNENARKKAA